MADQTSRLTQPIQPHYAGQPVPRPPSPAAARPDRTPLTAACPDRTPLTAACPDRPLRPPPAQTGPDPIAPLDRLHLIADPAILKMILNKCSYDV